MLCYKLALCVARIEPSRPGGGYKPFSPLPPLFPPRRCSDHGVRSREHTHGRDEDEARGWGGGCRLPPLRQNAEQRVDCLHVGWSKCLVPMRVVAGGWGEGEWLRQLEGERAEEFPVAADGRGGSREVEGMGEVEVEDEREGEGEGEKAEAEAEKKEGGRE